jgi:outer membrane protein assembly factor BamB
MVGEEREKRLNHLGRIVISFLLLTLVSTGISWISGEEKLILSDTQISFKVNEGEKASQTLRITNTTSTDIYFSAFKTGLQEKPLRMLSSGEEERGSYWLTTKQNYLRTGYNEIESAVPPFSYKWKYTSQRVFHSPVIAGRNLYIPCEDGNVYLIDSRTGVFKERFSFTSPILSLNLLGKYLIVVGKDELVVFDRSSKLFLWKYDMGSVEQNSVVIDSDLIFFATGQNLIALKLSDGTVIWAKEGSYITVTGSKERVIATSKYNVLTCFDGFNGNVLYNSKIDGTIVGVPTISGEFAYLTYIVQEQESYSRVVCYDSKGNKVWNYNINEIITSAQSVCKDYIIIGSVNGTVYALNRFSGTLLWKFEAGSPIHISPTIAEDIVYVGCNSGMIYGINIKNGEKIWEANISFPFYSEIALAQGFIYTTDNTGALVAYGREWENVIPPSSPEGLRGYPGDGFVTLLWRVSTYEADLSGYNVYRKGPYEAEFSFIEKLDIVNNYQDKKVRNDNEYNYLVRAYDTYGNESANSGQATVTPTDKWEPIWLKFTPTNGLIPKGSFIDMNIEIDASKVVAGSYSGYIYLVHSGDLYGAKPLEILISAEIKKKDIVKLAPKILSIEASDKRVSIKWTQVESAKSYKLFRSLVSKDEYQLVKEVPQDITFYVDENVKNGVRYYYAIKSVDKSNNESDYSEEVSIVPQPLPITVNLKDNSIVYEAIFDVLGRADPKAKLLVKGKVTNLDSSGNFKATVGVPVGTSIIDFKAYDTDGNLQELKVRVNYVASSLKIELRVDSKKVFVNSKEWPYELDVPPKIYNNRTFVPLRFLAETIGAEVNWYPTEKKITYKKGNTTIELWIGKKVVKVNGKELQIDVAPFIENGRTLVPLRFISEPLGAKVIWNEQDRSIQLIFSF